MLTVDYDKYFRAGLYENVKHDRFDSVSEKKVCMVLNRFLRKYDMDRFMDLRLTPQQPLDNYVNPSGNGEFRDFYLNRQKWMRFDFIFENVYEWKDSMNYVPVAVVEFDGPMHDDERQKKLDAYKNGIVTNIGASIVRISYQDLDRLDAEGLFQEYEEELLQAVIKGYFTKTRNYRHTEELINDKTKKQFDFLSGKYEKAMDKAYGDKKSAYGNMLRALYFAKETMFSSGN